MTINEIQKIYPWITEEEYTQHSNGGGWKHKTASVPASVHIPENTYIGGSAIIGDRASIGGGAIIGGGASIGDGVNKVLCIQGTAHTITACTPTRDVQIGCKRHSIDWWLNHYKEVGAAERYTDDQIREYGIHLTAVKNWLDIYYPEKEN